MQYFHVIFKSRNDKTIFHKEADYVIYLQQVKRACEKYAVAWLAYAIMSNHIHLVLCGDQDKLPHLRYNISSGYAAYYRRSYPCYSAPGEPVFCSHNTTKWLQANNDLRQGIRYVNRNPIEKALECELGDSICSSYSALLAARRPDDQNNPFNLYEELREIRDALNADMVFRAFGKNHSEQWQHFIAFHKISAPDISVSKNASQQQKQLDVDWQRAELILKQHFSTRYSYSKKEYNEKNRQEFLGWLGKRGNPAKANLVHRLLAETQLSCRQIAAFLQLGHSTVQNIINQVKG